MSRSLRGAPILYGALGIVVLGVCWVTSDHAGRRIEALAFSLLGPLFLWALFADIGVVVAGAMAVGRWRVVLAGLLATVWVSAGYAALLRTPGEGLAGVPWWLVIAATQFGLAYAVVVSAMALRSNGGPAFPTA